MRYVVGITGGIGSGKSCAVDFFKNKGFYTIDADRVGHGILDRGTDAYYEVIRNFNCLSQNGDIDRKKLGSIVFTNPQKLALLNSITHPAIKEAIMRDIEFHEGIIILECALMFDSRFDSMCDECWLITADEETRVKRIMERNNITAEEARNRILSQADYNNYIPKCAVTVYNDSSLAVLNEKLEKEYETLIRRIN